MQLAQLFIHIQKRLDAGDVQYISNWLPYHDNSITILADFCSMAIRDAGWPSRWIVQLSGQLMSQPPSDVYKSLLIYTDMSDWLVEGLEERYTFIHGVTIEHAQTFLFEEGESLIKSDAIEFFSEWCLQRDGVDGIDVEQ